MAVMMGLGLVGIGVTIGMVLSSVIYNLSWRKVFKAGQDGVKLSAMAKQSLEAAIAYEEEAKKYQASGKQYEAEAKKCKEEWELASQHLKGQIERSNSIIQEVRDIKARSSGC